MDLIIAHCDVVGMDFQLDFIDSKKNWLYI